MSFTFPSGTWLTYNTDKQGGVFTLPDDIPNGFEFYIVQLGVGMLNLEATHLALPLGATANRTAGQHSVLKLRVAHDKMGNAVWAVDGHLNSMVHLGVTFPVTVGDSKLSVMLGDESA